MLQPAAAPARRLAPVGVERRLVCCLPLRAARLVDDVLHRCLPARLSWVTCAAEEWENEARPLTGLLRATLLAALAEARDEAAQVSLRVLRNFTCVFWTVFPLVWAMVQCNLVSVFTEEVLWSCADICGKVGCGSSTGVFL